MKFFVKLRSTQPLRPARFSGDATDPLVEFDGDEFGVAKGQACVFYEHGAGEARILGGGFIASAEA
jgi:tRNA-specific 2-thiouridylase